jgi:hypothetical protein
MQTPTSFRLAIVALGEWVMVLPATVFLAAAALRFVQPPQYQPAHTSWTIFQWTTTHISRLDAATLFIGMPGLVVIAGCAVLLLLWREDKALRSDAILVLRLLRQRLVIGLLASATLLAGSILITAMVHVMTD